MRIFVSYKPRTKTKTVNALKSMGLFSDVSDIDGYALVLETAAQTRITQSSLTSIKRKLGNVPTIVSVTLYHESASTATSGVAGTARLLHIFFDIDSTLTHPGIKILTHRVKTAFSKFRLQKCSVYFCTGRADHEVCELMEMYKTDDYGIAENGGIIINSGLPACKHGDRSEPDKLITHMNERRISFCLDPDQQTRKTEYVITRDSITRQRLEKAARDSRARIDIHESKNTYHVGKVGINKGSAIDYLTGPKELDLNSDTHLVVAVGDSELDLPMFERADRSYAVGNADQKVKAAATVCLRAHAPDAVEELYDHLFPSG